jgi:hypothetical protein
MIPITATPPITPPMIIPKLSLSLGSGHISFTTVLFMHVPSIEQPANVELILGVYTFRV